VRLQEEFPSHIENPVVSITYSMLERKKIKGAFAISSREPCEGAPGGGRFAVFGENPEDGVGRGLGRGRAVSAIVNSLFLTCVTVRAPLALTAAFFVASMQ
jgi:hypothetical protein